MASTTVANDKEIEIPEWDHAAVKNDHGTTKGGFGQKFDRIMPPHRKYLGLKRKTFLWVLLAVLLALLALIIGLAVGLSLSDASHGRENRNLPLPSNSATFTGDLTYYTPGLGACGVTSTSSDLIVSISHILFDAAGSSTNTGGNSNDNPLCGKALRASRFDEDTQNQESVDLIVVDRCTGCEVHDLDTSLDAFERLAPVASGRVDVTWAWLEPVQTGS